MTDTIAACMIVKDGAATVERAIASVRPYVDEVCIFLGGESTDGTPELLDRIAAEPGSPVLIEQGEWRGDFAWAREQSFAMSDATWALWIDDDEVLDDGRWLEAELQGCDVLMALRLDVASEDAFALMWLVRAVRNGVGARWRGRVHEYVDAGDDLRWHAAPSDRVMFTERRLDHLPAPGRHIYMPTIKAEYAETRHPRLALCIAGGLLVAGRASEGEAALHELLATFRSDEKRFDPIYLRALEALCNSRWLAGDREATAGLLAERERITREWSLAAASGRLRGRKALQNDLRRLEHAALCDLRDLTDRDLRYGVFTRWEAA